MKLVDWQTPDLYRQAKSVTPDDLALHAANTIPRLIDFMHEIGAAGITAPSIGLDLAFFITKWPMFGFCANPSYEVPPRTLDLNTSRPERSVLRGSWSTYVRRPEVIRTRFTRQNGTEQTGEMIGMDARVFAHLCDSLAGKQLWAAPAALAKLTP